MEDHESGSKSTDWLHHVNTFKIVAFSLLMLVGVPLNALVLLAVRKTGPRVTKSYMYIIANMAVADLLLLLLLPLEIVIQKSTPVFPLGGFMCRVFWPIQTALFAVAVFTYTALGFQRFYAILPQPPGHREVSASIQITIIWVVSLLVVLPYVLILTYTEEEHCEEVWRNHVHRQLYTVFLFLVQYVLPLVCVIYLYWKIANFLKWCESRNIEFQKRITRMLAIIVLVFAVCTLPHHVMWLILDYSTSKLWRHFWDLLNIMYIFTYTNSVANPIIFFVFNEELRKMMLKKFQRLWKKRREGTPKGSEELVADGDGTNLKLDDIQNSAAYHSPV